ncbi:uncharacterized protein JCM15063_003229 [Sporobolomyces koalae]|uniref:uncharacterized protein n=1 Tax=Sporobolomyces koalae TaxID=500713 RepID=UPI00317591F6
MSHTTKRPRARHSVSPPPEAHYLASFSHAPQVVPSAHDLSIQAHEATLIPGYDHLAQEIETTRELGGRLAPWPGDERVSIDRRNDPETDRSVASRYDILNLITSLPPRLPFSNPTSFPPISFQNLPVSTTDDSLELELDVGFSDLGSDHEEEFYFRQMSRQERDELDKKRKRRRLERGREERIKLLEQHESSVSVPVEEEIEPSSTQLELMLKLNKTLSTAQNPSLLEMRILTNHSSDPRFQFLKKGGKWRDVWERIRRGDNVRREEDEPKPPNPTSTGSGLAGLGAYGSSGSESESDVEEPKLKADAANTESALASNVLDDSDGGAQERQKQEEKAAKVKEWARKRKEARETLLAKPENHRTDEE